MKATITKYNINVLALFATDTAAVEAVILFAYQHLSI